MLFLYLKSSYDFSSFMVKSKLIAITAYKAPADLASATSSNSSHIPPTAYQPQWPHICCSNKLSFTSKWHFRPLVIAIKRVCDAIPQDILLLAPYFQGHSETASSSDRTPLPAQLRPAAHTTSRWFIFFTHWFIFFTTLSYFLKLSCLFICLLECCLFILQEFKLYESENYLPC